MSAKKQQWRVSFIDSHGSTGTCFVDADDEAGAPIVTEKRATFDEALRRVQAAHEEMTSNPNVITREAWLDALDALRVAHDESITESMRARGQRWPR